jgi:hypothetical protein
MNERRFRFDLIIAVSALLISTVAALASVYQTSVIREQLSAAVWPYLSIDRTYNPTGITISITNYGLGPALVRSASMQLDGKPRSSWNEVIATYVRLGHEMHAKGRIQTTDANLDGSVVLSPGATRRLFDVRADGTAIRAVKKVDDITMNICYCSLLGQCWETTSKQNAGPVARSSCPIGPSIGAPSPPQ